MTSYRHPILFLAVTLALPILQCGGSTTSEPLADGGTHRDSSGPKVDASNPVEDAPGKRDTGPACVPEVPATHVATAMSCSTTRGPSMPGDAGTHDGGTFGCQYDSECTDGTNGRCMGGGQVIGCNYDECSSATPCPANQICSCGTPDGTGRGPNLCLPATCQTDSDCGAGGYCSPTYGTTCGAYGGVVGYYCHTHAQLCDPDECTNDSDCKGQDAGNGISTPAGYCAWDPSSSKWTCEYSVCAG
jgi:hypothetical protein